MQGFRSSTAVIAAMVMAIAGIRDVSAATQQLACVLTDIGTRPDSENRAITIVFDDAAKALSAQDGAQSFRFASISISNVVINGATDSISIGVDRSSLGIVWQKYGSTGVVTEYGKCRRSGRSAAAAPN